MNPSENTSLSGDELSSKKIIELEDTAALKASRMATLLGIEAGAREAETVEALAIKAVNDPRALTGFEQAFCLQYKNGSHYRTIAITSQADVNRSAPVVQFIEACAKKISLVENPDEAHEFNINEIDTEWSKEQATYPYRYCYWLPILCPETKNSGEKSIFSGNAREQLGAILLTKKTPWREVDIIVLKRVIDTYAHSWHALVLGKKSKPTLHNKKKLIGAMCATAFAIAMFIPIPYTAVAPAQIVAKNPWVVSAPIDGVIEEVLVNPNDTITEGQQLLSFVDTTLRNSATIAESELSLAEARFENIKRSALIANEGRREIAIADAERKLADIQEKYARELLNKVNVHAPKNGIILFTDKNDLNGQPVSTGQKIMEIANPEEVAISIEVSPGDELTMELGQEVDVYLDVDPLNPIKGTLTRANFKAKPTETGSLAYIGIVDLQLNSENIPRIGLRGTAKLNAGKTALGFWLFRKPIVILRRTFGI